MTYRFAVLGPREWQKRMAHFPETRNLTHSTTPDWFFDYERDEYISYQPPLDEGLASEIDTRVEKAQRETWKDCKKRRKVEAGQRGIRVYTGKREKAAAGDHDHWIYLYKVKGLGSDQIVELEYPGGNGPDNAVNSVEKAIRRRLELAHIDFLPFGEMRGLLKEIGEIENRFVT